MEVLFFVCGIKTELISSNAALEIYGDTFNDSNIRTENFVLESALNAEGLVLLNEAFFILDKKEFSSLISKCVLEPKPVKLINDGRTVGIVLPANFAKTAEIRKYAENLSDFEKLIEDLCISEEPLENCVSEELGFIIDSVLRLSEAQKIMSVERNLNLLEKGVFIEDPESVKISSCSTVEPGAVIRMESTISSGSKIESGAFIGVGCQIAGSEVSFGARVEQNSRLVSSKISCGVAVLNSTVLESSIGENSKIGPYAYLRPGTVIGKNVKIGDFVEVKNSNIGDGTKVSHLTYVGDADVGENVNIGCGVVFVNYDGVKKYRSRVGDGAFIGCNANLVSPVNVGKAAFVAAGSTITDDVESKQLAIARARQINKDGWALKTE